MSLSLKFRNIDVTPDDPVEQWGFEGLLAAIDRGEVSHWERIAAAVARSPWGPVARLLEAEVLPAASDLGVVGALSRVIELERAEAAATERAEVAEELRQLLAASGLSQGEFASRLGTSRTRLNTYLTGRVVPAATVVVRARRLVNNAQR